MFVYTIVCVCVWLGYGQTEISSHRLSLFSFPRLPSGLLKVAVVSLYSLCDTKFCTQTSRSECACLKTLWSCRAHHWDQYAFLAALAVQQLAACAQQDSPEVRHSAQPRLSSMAASVFGCQFCGLGDCRWWLSTRGRVSAAQSFLVVVAALAAVRARDASKWWKKTRKNEIHHRFLRFFLLNRQAGQLNTCDSS